MKVPKIFINGKEVSSEYLSHVGFTLVGLATSLDRCKVQVDQAVSRPTDKEIMEAERSVSIVSKYVSRYKALLGELGGVSDEAG